MAGILLFCLMQHWQICLICRNLVSHSYIRDTRKSSHFTFQFSAEGRCYKIYHSACKMKNTDHRLAFSSTTDIFFPVTIVISFNISHICHYYISCLWLLPGEVRNVGSSWKSEQLHRTLITILLSLTYTEVLNSVVFVDVMFFASSSSVNHFCL